MKILYVATVASHICQFHLPYLEMLQKNGAEVHVAAKDNLAEKNGLQLKFTDKHFDIPFERSPTGKHNIEAYTQLKNIISENNYDIIVCNTPMGGILTRLAARKARKKGTRVIYIAHGFHFYKGAPKKYWLTFYPIEKFFSRYCDTLITINKEDYNCAKKHFKTNVHHIHGIGVDPERFHPVDEATKQHFRENLNLTTEEFVILCTGELNANKNQAQLISAAALLKDKLPNLKVLLSGNGPNEANLLKQIHELNLQNNVKLLGYRTDLEKIVPAVDLIVSCSKREGLGLNIIEGMLCEKPIVATFNRGHTELIKENQNGYLVNIDDYNALSKKIFDIAINPDKSLEMGCSSHKAAQHYTIDSVKQELLNLLA